MQTINFSLKTFKVELEPQFRKMISINYLFLVTVSLNWGSSEASSDPMRSYTNSSLTTTLQQYAEVVKNSVNFVLNGLVDNTPIANDVTFWCSNQQNKTLVQVFANDSAISRKINLKKPMVLLIHGWLASVNSSYMLNMHKGLIDNNPQ